MMPVDTLETEFVRKTRIPERGSWIGQKVYNDLGPLES
jgi:hypothetical protein